MIQDVRLLRALMELTLTRQSVLGALIGRLLLQYRWPIAAAVAVFVLCIETIDHELMGPTDLTPGFLGEAFLLGAVLPLLAGLALTAIAHTGRAAAPGASEPFLQPEPSRVLLVESESVAGAAIRSMLDDPEVLDMHEVAPEDEEDLAEAILARTPQTVVLDSNVELIDALKLLSLLPDLPTLRIVEVHASDNLLRVYERRQLWADKRADLVAAVRGVEFHA